MTTTVVNPELCSCVCAGSKLLSSLLVAFPADPLSAASEKQNYNKIRILLESCYLNSNR